MFNWQYTKHNAKIFVKWPLTRGAVQQMEFKCSLQTNHSFSPHNFRIFTLHVASTACVNHAPLLHGPPVLVGPVVVAVHVAVSTDTEPVAEDTGKNRQL